MTELQSKSIKQHKLHSYNKWKVAKSSLGRNPHLLQYFFNKLTTNSNNNVDKPNYSKS